MKKLFTSLLLLVAIFAGAQNREHRSIWMSAYLGEWPGQAITASSYKNVKARLDQYLDNAKAGNINAIYYHARGFCDAYYESAYEPWATQLIGSGETKPYADPMQMIIDGCHERGIELYAWLNPYRYCNTFVPNKGSDPLYYENCHPDWLLSAKTNSQSQTILNPALPEVKQRIADICVDILNKYDVDGIVFDDYFYTNGTAMDVDAEYFAKYGAGFKSQADWRRENVNDMVRKVNKAIKDVKPYVSFGIGPAGVANHKAPAHPEIPLSPGSGFQYDGIYSDPVQWLKEQTIDFISPQIYWPTTANFMPLTDWWNMASNYFGRHCYTSVYLSDLPTLKTQEFINQIEYTRKVMPENQSGIVYFSLEPFIGVREKYNGDAIDNFYNIIRKYANPTIALNPLQHWKGERNPVYVKNLVKNGSELAWTKDDNMRYVVYSVPATVAEPEKVITNPEYIAAVRYTNSYSIPAGSEGNTFAVAAYDRYGYLYSPFILGKPEVTAAAPKLVSPADKSDQTLFVELNWEPYDYEINLQLSYDPEMKGEFFSKTGRFSSFRLTDLPNIDQSKTIYWRVSSLAPNSKEVSSEIRSFNISALAVDMPAEDVSLTPAIEWTVLGPGVSYKLELSKASNFNPVLYSVEQTETKVVVPENILSAYSEYYVRVIASRDGITINSPAAKFRTLEMAFSSAPEIITPSADGETVYSDSKFEISRLTGAHTHIMEISASASMPSRSTTRITGNVSDLASSVKVSSKYLEDGKTYYIRCYANYSSPTSQSVKTPNSAVRSFVYSSQNSGVEEIVGDSSNAITIEGNVVTLAEKMLLNVYDASGKLVLSEETEQTALNLAPGIYILKAGNESLKVTL